MRKKYIRILITLLIFVSLRQICFGISDNFKFVIDTIGVPRYNVLGDEINERIYYTYNVFVYSSPQEVSSRTNLQRYKNVENGKWKDSNGVGEYDILGVDYSGGYVHNVYFPVDSVPECLPDKWHFVSINGAIESWNDKNKYKYIEQLEYMKNTKLLFDTINYQMNTSDPYNLVEYNITANSIGLDKVRLNTASTWKTSGVVSINRINNSGQRRYATLATKPIAASADIKSYINVPSNIVLGENEDKIEFAISYGARAVNLNNYAKKEHIKEINSELKINGNVQKNVKASKIDYVNQTYNYIISREKFKPGTYTLALENNSYLYTEFYVDGLIQNNYKKQITIQVKPKKVVPIENVSVKVLEKDENGFYLKELIKTKFSEQESSIGVIEKEKHLAVKLKSGDKIINKDNLKVYINGVKMNYSPILCEDNNIVLDIKIPENIPTSILSWNEYRNREGNYFLIDFDEIGSRILNPNNLKIEYNGQVSEILFDTMDSFKYNINYIFENDILGNSNNKIRINEWKI